MLLHGLLKVTITNEQYISVYIRTKSTSGGKECLTSPCRPWQYGVEMRIGKRGWGLIIFGCSFSGFSFPACVTFYLAFENQNKGRYKNKMKHFFWWKIDSRIYVSNLRFLYWKIVKRHVFLHGHGDYEKIR